MVVVDATGEMARDLTCEPIKKIDFYQIKTTELNLGTTDQATTAILVKAQ